MPTIEEINEITRSKFRSKAIAYGDKQILLHRIAELVIRLTHKYHKENRDIVGELYENSVAIDQIIGQEMERIRMQERGGKP